MNIIFDLGGVVIAWDPDMFVAEVFRDRYTQKLAREHILDHNDWVELDRGTLKKNDAIKRGAMRSGLSESEVSRLIMAVPHFLVPVQDSIQLIKQLKNSNNKLYALSNLHIASIDHLESTHSFLDLFDGQVISCRINSVKPEPEIYHYLIDKYKLEITNTVFIDDTKVNLLPASGLGMKTILFENPEQCRDELEMMGCLG